VWWMDEKQQVLTLGERGLMPVLEGVHEQVEVLLTLGPRAVLVDISEVSDLSSTAVAALLWIRRRCSERGVDVVLRGATGRNRDALKRIGFDPRAGSTA
jgi:anti-anti-sigma regulatory factor